MFSFGIDTDEELIYNLPKRREGREENKNNGKKQEEGRRNKDTVRGACRTCDTDACKVGFQKGI